MTAETVRAVLALSIVIGVLLVCAALVLVPMIAGLQNPKEYLQVLKDFGGLFSGIIGTVISYYFGRSGSR